MRESKNKSETLVPGKVDLADVTKSSVLADVNVLAFPEIQSETNQTSDSTIRVVKKLEHGLVLFAMEPLAGKENHYHIFLVLK
jgi:hypothetical protein